MYLCSDGIRDLFLAVRAANVSNKIILCFLIVKGSSYFLSFSCFTEVLSPPSSKKITSWENRYSSSFILRAILFYLSQSSSAFFHSCSWFCIFLATKVDVPQIWSIILVHSMRATKRWEDSGNKVSGAGQSQAPAALSTASPCCCLAVPCTNRLGDYEEEHVSKASCQGRNQPSGHGPRACWEAVVCPV